MKIYISGKITGLTDNQVKEKFSKAENAIKNTGIVINPLYIPYNGENTWENRMKADIKALMDCDHIYMLKDWKTSKGAVTEYELAKLLGIKVLYES